MRDMPALLDAVSLKKGLTANNTVLSRKGMESRKVWRPYRRPRPALSPRAALYRLRLAWGVFTGRYDAVDWMD